MGQFCLVFLVILLAILMVYNSQSWIFEIQAFLLVFLDFLDFLKNCGFPLSSIMGLNTFDLGPIHDIWMFFFVKYGFLITYSKILVFEQSYLQ